MGRRIDPSWMNPLSNFPFQPVIHEWCNKGRGVCYPLCGMVHITLAANRKKSSPCGGRRFPLSLSEWSFTICRTPYNRKSNVLSASLNTAFPSFLPIKLNGVSNGSPNWSTWAHATNATNDENVTAATDLGAMRPSIVSGVRQLQPNIEKSTERRTNQREVKRIFTHRYWR